MKHEEMKVGQRVTDSWFPHWGVGKVIKVMKTRVRIVFKDNFDTEDEPTVYDRPHLQFLRPVKRQRKKV